MRWGLTIRQAEDMVCHDCGNDNGKKVVTVLYPVMRLLCIDAKDKTSFHEVFLCKECLDKQKEDVRI